MPAPRAGFRRGAIRRALVLATGRAAVAVRLTATSPRPQANVPVLVDVTGE